MGGGLVGYRYFAPPSASAMQKPGFLPGVTVRAVHQPPAGAQTTANTHTMPSTEPPIGPASIHQQTPTTTPQHMASNSQHPAPSAAHHNKATASSQSPVTASTAAGTSSAVTSEQPRVRNTERADPTRVFSAQELSLYDGSDPCSPIYLSIKGNVYDVTHAGFYEPPGGYSQLNGRECGRSLATMEIDNHASDLSNLSDAQLTSLEEWERLFKSKYTCMGTLVE